MESGKSEVVNAQELARRLLVAAGYFGAAAVEARDRAHPGEIERLMAAGAKFSARVEDLLGSSPRVAIVADTATAEVEIASASFAYPISGRH